MTAPLVLLVDDNVELVDLLAQVLEEAGYRTKVCHRGKAALEALDAERPDLAIVDILLPDIMGYDVAKAAAVKDVPVIFVTGVFKGGRHALEAQRKHGSRAYFEKPFEASKLLATLGQIVPPPPPADRPAASSAFEAELELDVEELEPLTDSVKELTGRIRVSGSAINAVLTGDDFQVAAASPGSTYVRQGSVPPPEPPAFAMPGVPAPPQPAPGFDPPPGSPRAAVPQALLRTPGPAPAPELVSVDGRVRRGELRDNLPQLVTAFWHAQNTGELGLSRGKVRKVIYFEKGQPIFASSNLASDRFGSFLVRIGKINAEQLRIAADAAAAQKRRTGDVLIAMGLLKDAERMYYVAQQVKAIIYSSFAWENGEYVLTFTDKAKAEPIRLGIHPAHLISRGIKKLYKPERLQRLLPLEERLIPSPDPLFQLTELELETWEAQLLTKITGERTVAELLVIAGKPAPLVYGSLAALLGLKVLERREAVLGLPS